MEETKKSNNLGFLFAILKVLGAIIGIVAVVLIGIYVYVRVVLGIDIFGIIRIVKNISNFDESTMITAPVTETDREQAFAQFDLAGLSGFYTVEDGEYTIKDDISSLPTASQDIALSDVQTCALVQSIINSSLKLDQDLTLDLSIKQIKFSNYVSMANGGKIDVNMVFHTSLKELKTMVNTFPINLFIKYIPDDAYVSANFSVEQTDTLSYSITPKDICVNNLTPDQTAIVLSVIGSALDGVTSQSLCRDIGNLAFQALIGNDEGTGLARELDIVGINSFAFEQDGDNIKFVLKI